LPTIVDPDYTYVKLKTTVLYDPKKTTLTPGQLKQLVIATIRNFSTTTLNTFNATLKLPELITSIQYCDLSIVTNETEIRVEKKVYPVLNSAATYQAKFGFPLKRNYSDVRIQSSLYSEPDITVLNTTVSPSVLQSGVYYREIPPINGKITGSVTSVNVTNQGFNYTKTPTVKISGDGDGANAVAILANGRIIRIDVTNAGSNYSYATVAITPAAGDKTGQLGAAIATLDSAVCNLETFYYPDKTVITQVINADAGTISYNDGIVTLKDFSASSINNEFGYLKLSAVPASTILTSDFNRILTIDEFDPSSIEVTVTAIQR